jgi:hypothetical protein
MLDRLRALFVGLWPLYPHHRVRPEAAKTVRKQGMSGHSRTESRSRADSAVDQNAHITHYI